MQRIQYLIVVTSMVLFTGCFQGSQKRALEAGEQPLPPVAAEGAPIDQGIGGAPIDGGQVAIDGEAPASVTPGVAGVVNGSTLTAEQLAVGKAIIEPWLGLKDEIPADAGFTVKSILTPSKGGDAPDKVNDTPDADPDANADPDPDPNAGNADPSVVIFEIGALPGQAVQCARSNGQCKDSPWNSAATPIVITDQTRTLRIVNKDTVSHQLHGNGQVLQHGDSQLAPGESEDISIISTNFTTLNLYDHGMGEGSQARVYFQKQ